MENNHVVQIPPAVMEEVQMHIDAANAALTPYLLPLTPEERHSLPKMGNKTLSFVEKSLDYVHHYPNLCPSYFDTTQFEIDLADATGLRTVRISTQQLADNIDDTIVLAGSEAYQAALVFYNAVKIAASQNIPGAKEVYNDLKARFPRTKRKNEE